MKDRDNKINKVVNDLFGPKKEDYFFAGGQESGLSDMITEGYFVAAFDTEVEEKIGTQDVWIKTMQSLKTEEDKDNAWHIYNMFIQEKILRSAL